MANFKFRNKMDKKAYERALAEIEKKNKTDDSQRESRLRSAKANIVDTAERYNKISEIEGSPIVGFFEGKDSGSGESSVQRYRPARNFDLDASSPPSRRKSYDAPRQRMASTEVVDIASYKQVSKENESLSESSQRPTRNFERHTLDSHADMSERDEQKRPSYFDILMGDIAKHSAKITALDDGESEIAGAEGIPKSLKNSEKQPIGSDLTENLQKDVLDLLDEDSLSEEEVGELETLTSNLKPQQFEKKHEVLKVPILSSKPVSNISIKTSLVDALPLVKKKTNDVKKTSQIKSKTVAPPKKRKKRIDIDIFSGGSDGDII